MLKQYEKGRICKYEGCSTPLSIYNPGNYCGVHEQYDKHLRSREAGESLRLRPETQEILALATKLLCVASPKVGHIRDSQ